MLAEWNLDGEASPWSDLFTALNEELQLVRNTEEDQINYLKTCLGIARTEVEELKLQLHDYKFPSTENEIHFFNTSNRLSTDGLSIV